MIALLAQITTQPSPIIVGGVNLSEYLGSIMGIITLSTFAITLSKPYIAKIPTLNKVPVFVLSLLLSIALTLAAVYGVHSMSGSLVPLVIAVFIQTVAAAGFQVDNPVMLLHQSLQSSAASDSQLVSAKNLRAAGPDAGTK